MNGIILVNKPQNLTSRDVVNHISKIYQTKKVGHTGTLDPIATGVLVICLGTYTKLVNRLTSLNKEYIATMQLGYETDTLDTEGSIIHQKISPIPPQKIIQTFQNFPHEYIQTVPKYSAVKVQGKKLYEYARENIPVKLPSRLVQINNLELLKIANQTVTFKATVSKGTYIRSLIKDLAFNMDTYATMTNLIRTKQGPFSLEQTHNFQDITSTTPLLTVQDIFSYPTYEITKKEYLKVQNGNLLKLNSSHPNLFLTYHHQIIAIYEKNNDRYQIVFKITNNN